MAGEPIFVSADFLPNNDPVVVQIQWDRDIVNAGLVPSAFRLRDGGGAPFIGVAVEEINDEVLQVAMEPSEEEPTVPGPGRITILGPTGINGQVSGVPTLPVVGRYTGVHILTCHFDEDNAVMVVTWSQAATLQGDPSLLTFRMPNGVLQRFSSLDDGDGTAVWTCGLSGSVVGPATANTFAMEDGLAEDANGNLSVAQAGELT